MRDEDDEHRAAAEEVEAGLTPLARRTLPHLVDAPLVTQPAARFPRFLILPRLRNGPARARRTSPTTKRATRKAAITRTRSAFLAHPCFLQLLLRSPCDDYGYGEGCHEPDSETRPFQGSTSPDPGTL